MQRKWGKQLLMVLSIYFAVPVYAKAANEVDEHCKKIALKLASVSYDACRAAKYTVYKTRSTQNAPLIMKEFKPAANVNAPKILFIGGIHGDEYSSVSATFKWLKVLENHHSGKFHWLFLPLANPDGLLRESSQRMNAKGVDLNRNFPPYGDKHTASLEYWSKVTKKDPRRFPGDSPMSEPETQAMVEIIESFKPDVIVSVHAPFDLLDFDGATDADAPKKLGSLDLQLLGTYPGSLGNYAWLKLKIPVITLELPSSEVIPAQAELDSIWMDLVSWLKDDLPKTRLASNMSGNQLDIMKN
ncbi:MAG: M14 family murein peptide amidase A [Methylococcales bacterium]